MCPADNLMVSSNSHCGLYSVYVVSKEVSKAKEAEAVCSVFHLNYVR